MLLSKVLHWLYLVPVCEIHFMEANGGISLEHQFF